MDIPPLSLASRPDKKITLREATVEETIQFAAVDPSREELATTLFLNTVQKPEGFYDSKLWTGDDRRLLLLWYWLHTNPDDVTVTPSYSCECGESHTTVIDMGNFTKTYRPMTGKPEREASFKNRRIMIRPLNGEALEEIELHLAGLRGAAGEESGTVRSMIRKITVLETVLLFSFGDIPLAEKEKEPGKERKERERFISNMGHSDFEKFRAVLSEKIEEMEHGIDTVYENGRIYLLTEPVQCPNTEVVKTRLRLPFRSSSLIPGL